MRIQKKIQYYRDDEYRLNKIKAATEYNKSNVDKLNEYHRLYYQNKKHKHFIDHVVCV